MFIICLPTPKYLLNETQDSVSFTAATLVHDTVGTQNIFFEWKVGRKEDIIDGFDCIDNPATKT